MKPITDANGAYESRPGSPSLLARLFPSLVFYVQYFLLMFYGSLLALSGRFNMNLGQLGSVYILRALERAGVRVHIAGVNALHAVEGPCVFVANHMSTLETMVLPGIIQPFKDVTFVVKRGLVKYPLFGHIMLAADPIVVDRRNARADLMAVLEQGTDLLRRGRSILIFPQTTRTHHFDPRHFNSIGVKLARAAQVPIVPIAVQSQAWGMGRIVKDFGPIDPSRAVHIAFGEPIQVQGRGGDEHQCVVEFITNQLAQWQGC
jgi:1-acyl-sn-glycerol-3-phosphate acyltransferase